MSGGDTVLTAAGHLRSGALRCVQCLFWPGLVTVVMSLHSVSLSLDDSSQDKQRKDSPGPKSSVTLARDIKLVQLILKLDLCLIMAKSKVWYFSQPDTLHWLEKIKNYKSCMTNIQKHVG